MQLVCSPLTARVVDATTAQPHGQRGTRKRCRHGLSGMLSGPWERLLISKQLQDEIRTEYNYIEDCDDTEQPPKEVCWIALSQSQFGPELSRQCQVPVLLLPAFIAQSRNGFRRIVLSATLTIPVGNRHVGPAFCTTLRQRGATVWAEFPGRYQLLAFWADDIFHRHTFTRFRAQNPVCHPG